MAEDSDGKTDSKELLPENKKVNDEPGDKDEAEESDGDAEEDEEEDEDDDDDEGEEEDEPKLKYARMTSNLGPVYRNGDATSAFLVAGDKMVGQ